MFVSTNFQDPPPPPPLNRMTAPMQSGDNAEVANMELTLESIRERETFKYDPSLRANARFNDTGRPLPSSELSASSDSVLTALAQLAAYQTNTYRALISLFDSSHQYFIAEATLLPSPTPNLLIEHTPQPLWFCGTAIPRNHAFCESALCAAVADSDPNNARELPLTLVPDLSNDTRFGSKLLSGLLKREPCSLYAAVPIKSSRGINIGVLCVLGNALSSLWNDDYTSRLKDISKTITDHLETKRSSNAYKQSKRINEGLGSFIKGKAVISGVQETQNPTAFVDNSKLEGALDIKQWFLQTIQQEEDGQRKRGRQEYESIGSRGDGKGKLAERSHSAPNINPLNDSVRLPTTTTHHSQTEEPNSTQDDPSTVFSRAASIIQEAFEVEGCLFFDATTADPSNSSCALLGFSTATSSSINGAIRDRQDEMMPRELLEQLLQRHRNGKIFEFESESICDEQQSSDGASDDAISFPTGKASVLTTENIESAQVQDSHSNQSSIIAGEIALLQKIFPNACSVAFMPVWDPAREKWLAGGFIYTLKPTRVLTVEVELSLFNTFAMTVAANLLKLEAVQMAKANSDALRALAFELRSPLHGVIFGTELLRETDLTDLQEDAALTIETCSRSLLDTLNLVAEYSRASSFETRRGAQEVGGISDTKSQKQGADAFKNSGIDALSKEFESMLSDASPHKQDKKIHRNVSAHRGLDSTQGLGQLSNADKASKKVLVVDGNQINLKVLSTYLGKHSYVCETATNGLEAVEAYTQNPSRYDAILLEMSMPIMDGLQAIINIRDFEGRNRLAAVAIFALTAKPSDDARREAVESGADMFVTKPVNLKALGLVLELVHTKHRAEEG